MLFILLCIPSVFGYIAPSSGPAPSIQLNDDSVMPRFGLGTWLGFGRTGPEEDEIQNAVEAAIDTGYRLIDTASIYNTEEQVGLAMNNKINDRTVKREDLFITTKHHDDEVIENNGQKPGKWTEIILLRLWNNNHRRESVVPALKISLKKLNLEYVDLYLIHFPDTFDLYNKSSTEDIDYLETWQGMIEAKKLGLTKSIGVSNFNIIQLQRLIDSSGITPAVLQVEVNLNKQQKVIREYCKSNNIIIMGYTPFGSIFYKKATRTSPPPREDDENLVKIANKHNKTVPQVVLRYLFELGVTPIPKSVNVKHLKENIDIFNFELTQEDRDLLKNYDVNLGATEAKLIEYGIIDGSRPRILGQLEK